jgi:quinol-cytochrome oxidoreductase complex cytochrome b subunit
MCKLKSTANEVPLMSSQQSSPSQSGLARGLFFACLVGMLLLTGWWAYGLIGKYGSPKAALSSTPTPSPDPNADRLAKPVLISPQNPTQLDQGALLYWGVCLTCHGDRGQGLTDEWRAVFGGDENCWTSKCHAANHPPQGFFIPRDRLPPAVNGPGSLARFNNAQELYDYIVVTMPWWKPGSLTSEKAWAVSSYILNMNGSLPQGVVLGGTNASAIQVHHLVNSSQNDLTGEISLAVLLALVAGVMILRTALVRKAVVISSETISPAGGAPARARPNFLLHLHPPTIPAAQARWSYTLGTGGLAIFLTLVLIVTGILEMFYYIPLTDRATISIQTIANFVPYGGLIRNLHFWGAQALVLVLFVHLLRIALTGAYKKPRRFNYLLGLVLLILTLALDFTGYILRWDQGTSWALVVGTNLIKTIPGIGNKLFEFAIGGAQLGSAALIRFYSWHTFGLTLAMVSVVIWHIFRIRRDGGIAVPPAPIRNNDERISRLELLRREMLLMAGAAIVLVLLSTFFPAPITPPLTSTTADLTNARAPWFFLWVQQLLKFGDPFLLGVAVPLIFLVILALIPYIFPKPADSELGRWFPKGGRIVQILISVLTLLILGLTLWAILPAPG